MKQNKKKLIVISLCFIVVVTIVVIALFILFKPKETYTASSNTSEETISFLYCSANKPSNAFFHDNAAINEINEIKLSFRNDAIDKIQLTYTGDYADSTAAKKTSDCMHADYNIFMGKTSVDFSDLSPNFSVIDNQIIINLFFNEKTFTPETVNLLFLTDLDAKNYKKYPLSTMKKSYESKGFSCKMTN